MVPEDVEADSGGGVVDSDDASEANQTTSSDTDDGGRRDVEVPLDVYKAVTVFSTLFAVASVLFGFVLLDIATNRSQAPLSEVDTLAAVAGIGCMVLGAATYAFSTRFRAEGMGKSKSDADQPPPDE